MYTAFVCVLVPYYWVAYTPWNFLYFCDIALLVTLLWLLVRLGYDRRALAAQSAVSVIVLLVSFFLAPAPPPLLSDPNAAVNINYVYGFDDKHPQTWMAPGLWFSVLMAFNLVGLYLPTHACFRKVFAPARS